MPTPRRSPLLAASGFVADRATRPRTRALLATIRRLSRDQHQVVQVAAEFADSDEWAAAGSPTAAHWIAQAADIEVSTAREWIRVGRCLRSLPATADAFARGVVSYSKVRTLTRFATADNEVELLALAEQTPAGHLGRAIAAWVERTSSTEQLERHQHSSRSCSWRTEPDGMVTFTVRLAPLTAGVLVARPEQAVMTTTARPEESGHWPTLAQQYADAVGALAETGSDRGSGGPAGRFEVVLHVRGDGCTLDDGSPIPGSVVERVAPTGFLRALIHDAEGRPINASSRRRHPTIRQRRVVKERDQHWVDCGASSLLEYDHVPDYVVSRRTVVHELQLRCAPCHAKRHEEI
ncbi:MAG: 13E12 repeat family protein [Acidimicrobiia bacterium]|nr:13E12 repeat family protein [Acidimicrobiia bacterium]